MVEEEGLSIYLAAKELNIKYSTAKAIFKKYDADGVIFSKKPTPKKEEHQKGIPLLKKQEEK
jgi:transposase